MHALRMYGLIAAGALAAAAGTWQWVRSHRVTAEQRERQRRQRLSTMGRICDGTVLDVQEISANGHPPTQLIIYTYDVGGVAYEASQDITNLGQFLENQTFKLGLSASVRYDPQNPGNSIVISESWTGIGKR
jgi:hypothetical protein